MQIFRRDRTAKKFSHSPYLSAHSRNKSVDFGRDLGRKMTRDARRAIVKLYRGIMIFCRLGDSLFLSAVFYIFFIFRGVFFRFSAQDSFWEIPPSPPTIWFCDIRLYEASLLNLHIYESLSHVMFFNLDDFRLRHIFLRKILPFVS